MTIPMEKLDEASRTLATTFAKQVAPKTGTDSVSGSSNLNRADKVEGVLLRISLGVKSSNASQEMPPFSAPVAVQENDLVEFEQLSTNVECFVGCLFGYVQLKPCIHLSLNKDWRSIHGWPALASSFADLSERSSGTCISLASNDFFSVQVDSIRFAVVQFRR